MVAPSTIVLKGQLGDWKYEEAAVVATLYPGHGLELTSTGIKKHSVVGGRNTRMFAVEDGMRGKGIGDSYLTTDLGRFKRAEAGDLYYVRQPANAVAVAVGDALASNGDGTFVKAPVGGSVPLYESVAASAAVHDSLTATAFDKSYTIPANTLKVGDVLTIEGQGIATATVSTDTLAVAVKIGTTAIVSIPATDVADNDIFYFRITLIVRTIGASGTIVADAIYNIGVPGTATTRAQKLASTAIDTTATQAITVVATWSTTNANSVRLDILTITRQSATGDAIWGWAEEAADNSAGAAEAFCKMRVA